MNQLNEKTTTHGEVAVRDIQGGIYVVTLTIFGIKYYMVDSQCSLSLNRSSAMLILSKSVMEMYVAQLEDAYVDFMGTIIYCSYEKAESFLTFY